METPSTPLVADKNGKVFRTRKADGGMELTEPEIAALDALRLWTRAQTDIALTARLDAFDLIQEAALYLLDGETVFFADFVEGVPGLAHLAAMVARFVEERAAHFLECGSKRYDPAQTAYIPPQERSNDAKA